MTTKKSKTKNSKTGSTTVRRGIIASAFALSALIIPHSCVTYYTVAPQILPDGSMTKTVYAHADSARLAGDLSSNPFYFMPDSSWKTAAMEHPVKEWLFMDDSAVLNIYASRHYETGEASSPMQPASEDYKDSPYLNPSEKWNRKRGFFFNTYEYSCRFSGLRDKMPVPIDSFMSEQEIHDWLTEPDNLSGMNGVEIYNMVLSTLTDKFADWYNSCYIKVYCDFIAEAAGDTLSTAQKEEISGRIRKTYDFIDDRVFDDNSVSKVASVMTDVTGNPAFVRAAATHRQQLTDTLSAIETAYMMPMTTAFVYKVHMPGRLTYANTDIKDQGVPVWKVDGYRLLAGDVVIEATSRRVNPLGFIIIGLVIIAGAAFILRPRRY